MSPASPTKNRQLILVRHAAVQIVPQIPSADWRLSAAGRDACLPLARSLRNFLPAHLVSSPEPKALETAGLVAQSLDLDVEAIAGLEEHQRATAPFFDSQDDFKAAVIQIFRQPDQLVFGEETGHQALRRFSAAIGKCLARWPGQNLMAVAHGTVIALYVEAKTGQPAEAFWRQFPLAGYVVLPLDEALP